MHSFAQRNRNSATWIWQRSYLENIDESYWTTFIVDAFRGHRSVKILNENNARGVNYGNTENGSRRNLYKIETRSDGTLIEVKLNDKLEVELE